MDASQHSLKRFRLPKLLDILPTVHLYGPLTTNVVTCDPSGKFIINSLLPAPPRTIVDLDAASSIEFLLGAFSDRDFSVLDTAK